MSRQRHRPGAGGRQPAPAATAASVLADAETLQQRGERRKGQEALPCFEQAATKYQEVLSWSGPGRPDREVAQAAAFGLAECCQSWAEALLGVVRGLPDEALSAGVEMEAAGRAAGLFQRCVEAYQQVREEGPGEGPGPVRADAAVNCGNALCSWAELPVVERHAAAQLLLQAVEAYQGALAQEGEADAATYSNLADAYVQQGELAAAAGEGDLAGHCFQAAVQAYEASCSMSDSGAGDDLPGLLHNWGCGLRGIAQHTQDPTLKRQLLDAAAEKLTSCLAFTRGDVAPANALGDVLVDAAELLLQQQQAAAAAAAAGQGQVVGTAPGGVGAGVDVGAVAALYRRAAEEGYGAALTIRRAEPDALVGLAEVHVALGRLAAGSGEASASMSHFSQAVGHYESALRAPQLLGSFAERRDVRYNYACAAALAGQPDKAVQVLLQLAALGALAPGEWVTDGDLVSLQGHPGLQQLLQQQQQQQQAPIPV